MERTHIQWKGDRLVLLDQRRLPLEEVYVDVRDAAEAATAIRDMVVRGAPAIGVTAAYGLALEAGKASGDLDALRRAAAGLSEARPTAVNLVWAVDRMLRVADAAGTDLAARLTAEAEAIDREVTNST